MILAILQARMSSTRLPGKVLLPLQGQPMLLRQIERIKRSQKIDKLIVATSIDATDDVLAELCQQQQIECYRGSLTDVLDRYYQAARAYQPDYVVRLTGDCPVADHRVIDTIIKYCVDNQLNYASNTLQPTYPDGLDVEVFTFASLEQAWHEAKLPSEREHVTPYIKHQPLSGNYRYSPDLSDIRLTLDEPADYELIQQIYAALYPINPDFSFEDMMVWLAKNLRLLKLNQQFMRDEGYAKSLREDQHWVKKQEEALS